MVETPAVNLPPDGRVALPSLVATGGGRIVAAHFGTYDYTAAFGITAAHQHMTASGVRFRPSGDAGVAGTDQTCGFRTAPTNVMPVPPHKAPPGSALSDAERAANTSVVQNAWRLHASHIRHSLVNGFYQGWDLHPAQLPTRFAAVYAFFLEGLAPASARLKNFVQKAAQATLVGEVFDDAATGQGLLNYFLRAMNCGAVSEAEAVEMSGLTVSEIRSRSFAAIVEGRKG